MFGKFKSRNGRRFIYLCHYDRPIAPGRSTCQHYGGQTWSLWERIRIHAAGAKNRTTPRLMQVAKERSIGFTVARVWIGKKGDEKRLKAQKNYKHYCPCCTNNPLQLHGLKELTPAEIHEELGELNFNNVRIVHC